MGLKSYLNATSDYHNNFTYDDFIRLYKLDLNMANMAKAFGVDYRTIKYWITIHETENKNNVKR